ncbi:hypothetical protein ACTOJ1_001365 [Shigella flexneri]
MNQLETAFSMFSRDPENIEQLFRRGRLRLDPEPMHVLYLYYMGKVSFYDIANSVYYSDSERLIAKRFMNIERELLKQKKIKPQK